MPVSTPAVCIFCDIVAGREAASPVYADDLVLAFLDNAPINPGHTLVIPKAHYASLSDLPEATGARIFAVGRHLVGAIPPVGDPLRGRQPVLVGRRGGRAGSVPLPPARPPPLRR